MKSINMTKHIVLELAETAVSGNAVGAISVVEFKFKSICTQFEADGSVVVGWIGRWECDNWHDLPLRFGGHLELTIYY